MVICYGVHRKIINHLTPMSMVFVTHTGPRQTLRILPGTFPRRLQSYSPQALLRFQGCVGWAFRGREKNPLQLVSAQRDFKKVLQHREMLGGLKEQAELPRGTQNYTAELGRLRSGCPCSDLEATESEGCSYSCWLQIILPLPRPKSHYDAHDHERTLT